MRPLVILSLCLSLSACAEQQAAGPPLVVAPTYEPTPDKPGITIYWGAPDSNVICVQLRPFQFPNCVTVGQFRRWMAGQTPTY